MRVPKLVCEVSDASGSAWFVNVYGGLGSEEHDEQAELSVERDFDQSSQVMLSQTCQVLEPAEDSLYCDALSISSSEFLRAVAFEFSVDSENSFDAFLLVSRIRNDRHRSLIKGYVSQALGTVLWISH